MSREKKIIKRLQEHYDYILDKGYEIVFLALQGSQNYGLDVYDEEYMSDIDTKAIILPSFEDIVLNREPKSTTLVLENNEHIDVKDIRVMFETYKKQNVNFIETLFTEFRIVNPKYKDIVQPLFDNNEEIAHINYNQALRCMAGMSMEKLKALQHPYPTIIDKIEKYGYDPKQLHHIIRMNEFIKKYATGISYKECLLTDKKDYLIGIKKGHLPEEIAVELATLTDLETKKIKDMYLKEQDEINQKGIDILNEVKYNLLKEKFKDDISPSKYMRKLEKERNHWQGQYHLLSRKIDVTPNSAIREKIEVLRKKQLNEYNIYGYTENYYHLTSMMAPLKELLEGDNYGKYN